MSIRNGLSHLSVVKPHSEGILVAGKALTYTCVRVCVCERERDCMIERERWKLFFFFYFSPQLVLLLVA